MSCMCVCPCAGEDQYGVLAQYYNIPWLSYRDAVWHEYFADTPGFKRHEIFPVDEERHPTPLGHRCGRPSTLSDAVRGSALLFS